jgi:hypothetical protein
MPTPSSSAATSTTPTAPDGVAYQCTGSAPAGIDIHYGSSSSGMQATTLPFTAHASLSESAQYYAITAQLHGASDVSCTITVTDAGQTVTSSGTAQGGHNSATPQICSVSDDQRHWNACA